MFHRFTSDHSSHSVPSSPITATLTARTWICWDSFVSGLLRANCSFITLPPTPLNGQGPSACKWLYGCTVAPCRCRKTMQKRKMEKVQISYSVLINDSFEKNRMDGIYHHYQPLTNWTRIWSGKFQYQMEHAAAISRLKPVIRNLSLVVLLCDSSCLTSSTMRRRSSSRCTTTRCSGSAMCTTQHGFVCCFFGFFFCGYDFRSFRFAVLWHIAVSRKLFWLKLLVCTSAGAPASFLDTRAAIENVKMCEITTIYNYYWTII